MPVCNFFLQGRCRYGEKCWNEHPRGGSRGGGGGGGGYNDSYSRSSGQHQARGEGGFRNRVWVNPSQQKGGYIQPSSFSSHGSNDWGRGGGGGGGGGRRDDVKSSEFSFSSQNRYSAFNSPSTFDRGGRSAGGGGGGGGGRSAGDEDDDKKLELVQLDMDTWERSRQWPFSCYSNLKNALSGFSDLSPEELRLEYYTSRASGDLQSYINGVNQLLSQWKSRIQEVRTMDSNARAAVLAELNGAAPPPSSSGFGSAAAAGFGSSVASFGSKGFGSLAAPQSDGFRNSGFGSAAAPVFGGGMATSTQPPSRFGGSAAPSASDFSFAAPTSNKPAATPGFGSASGFSFAASTNTGGGFGSGFGPQAPAASGSSSVFGQPSGGFGSSSSSSSSSSTAPPAQGAGSAGEASDNLFSPEDKLSEEELNQFKARRFTLGQVPLKPPPENMLVI